MITWQIQINGDKRDLQLLSEILCDGVRKVVRDGGGEGLIYLYESDSFSKCTTTNEVQDIGAKEIAALSGIVKFEHKTRYGLMAGSVHKIDENGVRHISVDVKEALEIRVSIGAVTFNKTDIHGEIIEQSPPHTHPSLALLQLSITDEAVAKVFRLLSYPDANTWSGLYRIYEVIQGDLNVDLAQKGWISEGNIGLFKKCANFISVSGDGARHGKGKNAPPKNPMTLIDAEMNISLIVKQWLEEKSGGKY